MLMPGGGHSGCHQAPAHSQLIDPGLWNGLAACRSNDAAVRRSFGKAQHAVAEEQVQIGDPESPQILARFFVQTAQALGLSRAELKRVARNSLEASFVPESLRAPWLLRLDAMPD